MADDKATTTAAPATSESASTGATGTKVADLGQVDEKALQSYVDAQVRKALKTREEHLAAEKAAELKKKEQEALKAAGDFATLQKQLEAERDAAMRDAQSIRVAHELKVAALQAGINDPDDVRLLPPDMLASLTDDKGAINREAVTKAIEALKTSKGYLFKSSTAPAPAFAGAPSTGSAVPSTPPADLTADAWFRARQQHADKVRGLRK